ncbi:MAG: carboxypeptidase regulatory-like domain-containing protein [Betaproteobacteria bacterium]|nr:carboxypeptidase regulatory-like domain-containing protein [Betaproteobacteria bacterium]
MPDVRHKYKWRLVYKKRVFMNCAKMIHATILALGVAVFMAAPQMHAQQSNDPAIRIGATDLGGVVTSTNGPEAGVWVIAETSDLPTKFAKIVVTDDQGRYVMPELPEATYSVWVRGYGLVDSPKVQTFTRKDCQPQGRGGAQCSGRG